MRRSATVVEVITDRYKWRSATQEPGRTSARHAGGLAPRHCDGADEIGQASTSRDNDQSLGSGISIIRLVRTAFWGKVA